MNEEKPPVQWGYTKTEFELAKIENNKLRPPHAFRNNRRICTGGKAHVRRQGWLFIPRLNFDPYRHPAQRGYACPDCMMILDMEKADEEVEE